MKRIIAFLILACLFVVILTLPATAAPATTSHSVPMWSILSYVAAVGIGGLIAFGMSREQDEKEAADYEIAV